MAKAQLLQQEYRRIARETGTTRALVEMQTQTSTPSFISTASQVSPTVSSSGSQAGVATAYAETQTNPLVYEMDVDEAQKDILRHHDTQNTKKIKVIKEKRAMMTNMVKRNLASHANVDKEEMPANMTVDDIEMQNRVDKTKRLTASDSSEAPEVKKQKRQSEDQQSTQKGKPKGILKADIKTRKPKKDVPPSTAPQSHGTGKVSYDSIDEWTKRGGNKAMLYDQLTKREGYGKFLGTVNAKGYNKNDPNLAKKIKGLTKKQIAEFILTLDGKPVK
jgi:hypothetical protein